MGSSTTFSYNMWGVTQNTLNKQNIIQEQNRTKQNIANIDLSSFRYFIICNYFYKDFLPLLDGKVLENVTCAIHFWISINRYFEYLISYHNVSSVTVCCIFQVIKKYIQNETRVNTFDRVPLIIRKGNSLKIAQFDDNLL